MDEQREGLTPAECRFRSWGFWGGGAGEVGGGVINLTKMSVEIESWPYYISYPCCLI